MIDPVKVYKDSLALKVTKMNIANNLKLVVVDSAFDVQEIANREKTTLQNLYMFNELEGEQPIIIGQNFFLQAKLKVNQLGAHEVKFGQSLYDISQIYGVTTQSLRALNRLEKWEQPAVGESVFLNSERNSYMRTRSYFAVQQEKEAVAEEQKRKQVQTIVSNMTSNPSFQKIEVAQTIPNTDKQIIIHKVAPQENIFKISKRYKVSPNDLLKWNDLTIEKPLSVGQSLKIIINLNN
jgi:LysM repeat protein